MLPFPLLVFVLLWQNTVYTKLLAMLSSTLYIPCLLRLESSAGSTDLTSYVLSLVSLSVYKRPLIIGLVLGSRTTISLRMVAPLTSLWVPARPTGLCLETGRPAQAANERVLL